MAFDFKKEYKEFYMPKNKPEIVNVPKANYIAVRGKGNPNEEGGAYQQAISVLYAVAYTLKMSYKTDSTCTSGDIIFDQLPYTADATYNRLNELKEENPNLAGKIEDIKDNIFE